MKLISRSACATVAVLVGCVFAAGSGAAHAQAGFPEPASAAALEGPTEGGTSIELAGPTAELKFTEFSAGGRHSLAFAENGELYAWGSNYSGQLGIGSPFDDQPAPVIVHRPAGTTFTQISAGREDSLALDEEGKIYAWGNKYTTLLGSVPETEPPTVPTIVSTPTGTTFTRVNGDGPHSLAIDEDGRLYAWGTNSHGQLGNGFSSPYEEEPALVDAPANTKFIDISAGLQHSLALDENGNVYAWGNNSSGELGNDDPWHSALPVLPHTPANTSFTQVSAGLQHSLALDENGRIYAWGNNQYGQIGNGTTSYRPSTPVLVHTPADTRFTQINAGWESSLALDEDGNIHAWGANNFGQLGNGSISSPQTTPGLVHAPTGTTFTSFSTGGHNSLAMDINGTVYAWGNNEFGQLGIGTISNPEPTPQSVTPVPVITSVTFDGVAATSFTRNPDGTVSAVTPAHAAGTVDIVIDWTFTGVPQTPITYPAGFTYVDPNVEPVVPTITDPTSQSVVDGASATFSVSTTDAASVSWEVLTDASASWTPVETDSTATPSADDLTLTVIGTKDVNNGYQYRATATNNDESATSEPALLTVTPAGPTPVEPTPPDSTPIEPTPSTTGTDDTATPTKGTSLSPASTPAAAAAKLASTGTGSASFRGWAAGLAIVVGASLLLVRRTPSRRPQSS